MLKAHFILQISTLCVKLNKGDIMFRYSDEKIHFHHSYDEHPLSMNFNGNPPHAHKNNEIFFGVNEQVA